MVSTENNSVKFTVTMDMAYKFLQAGKISADEYSRFLDRMSEKYTCENVRKLYQSMLDIYRDQSVNGDTKGV